MKEKIVIGRDFERVAPFDRPGAVDWWSLTGPAVARSRSSETLAIRLPEGAHELHLKRYCYSFRQAVRGALRNTFLFGLSRVEREFRTLQRIEDAVGAGFAPRAVAFGERRRAGFLAEAFLATETVPDARPLTDLAESESGCSRRLGAFLGRLHRAGVTHGRLYGRNLLVLPDGRFRIVDVDRAKFGAAPATEEEASADLACLFVSTPSLSARQRMRLIAGWLDPDRDREGMMRMLAKVEEKWDTAQRGLMRRDGPPHL